MLRIRFTTDYKNNRKGDIKEVSRNEAFGLIDRGVAIISKDMTARDITVTKTVKKKGKKWQQS